MLQRALPHHVSKSIEFGEAVEFAASKKRKRSGCLAAATECFLISIGGCEIVEATGPRQAGIARNSYSLQAGQTGQCAVACPVYMSASVPSGIQPAGGAGRAAAMADQAPGCGCYRTVGSKTHTLLRGLTPCPGCLEFEISLFPDQITQAEALESCCQVGGSALARSNDGNATRRYV
jgi:hypothetical protein